MVIMNIKGKKELIELLEQIQTDCGDNLDREGEYTSDKLGKAIRLAENLEVNSAET